jgi:hypothetical protein
LVDHGNPISQLENHWNGFVWGTSAKFPMAFPMKKRGESSDVNVPLNQSNEPTVLQGFVLDKKLNLAKLIWFGV